MDVWRAGALRGPAGSTRSATLTGQGILFAVACAYLIYYAASEDSYRRGGISRWEAYDAKALTVGAIATCLAVSGVALVADRRRGRLAWLAGVGGIAASLLFFAAVAANSLN